ncbi:MAG: tetratricopeptide repeat protein [Candidatus Omnitrophota bacterium]
MKKNEREHLKVDPFKQFIEKTLHLMRTYLRQIEIVAVCVVGIIVIVAGVKLYQYYSAKSENALYSKVIQIKADENLTVDQKIEKLSKLDTKGGICSSVKLFLASLYFEKGDLNKAREALDKYSSSDIKVLDDQKKLLEADILNASNKPKEALDILDKLMADPKSSVAKDFILIKMAGIQIKTGQKDTAKANLTKITENNSPSPYVSQAKDLLDQIND